MDEQTILSVDLYDNVLTEKKGDYTGKARITGTVRNADIAKRILARGSEVRLETIEYILDMSDQEKVAAITQGKSCIDGVGQYLVNVSGSFEGEKAAFDSQKHKLGVSYTAGKLLQEALKKVQVQTYAATTGPVINDIVDSTTGEVNNHLTSGGPAIINGINIRVAGDDPSVGVFLTKTGGTALKSGMLIHNNPSQITLVLPTLADGEYTLSIVTQSSSGNRLVKECRSYTLPVVLLVGEEEDDRPDIV